MFEILFDFTKNTFVLIRNDVNFFPKTIKKCSKNVFSPHLDWVLTKTLLFNNKNGLKILSHPT